MVDFTIFMINYQGLNDEHVYCAFFIFKTHSKIFRLPRETTTKGPVINRTAIKRYSLNLGQNKTTCVELPIS